MFRVYFRLSTICKLYQILQRKDKNAKLFLTRFVYIPTSKSRLARLLNSKGKFVKGTYFDLLGLPNDLA